MLLTHIQIVKEQTDVLRFFASLPALTFRPILKPGGGERNRTDGLLRARQALSQLSYTPDLASNMVGLDGVEPSTSRLSGVRSNRTELQAPGFSLG
jgi:hypothetical protein